MDDKLPSCASSARTAAQTLAESAKRFESSPRNTIELEVLPPSVTSPHLPPPWPARFARSIGFYHPRVQKVWRYFCGPQPPVNLPDPTPFLNLTLYAGRRSYSLALEPALIHATRRFRSPLLFAVLVVGYIIGFAFFSRAQSFQTPPESFIDCTASFWSPNAGCGLDGSACGPFNDTSFSFRCPAQCSGVVLQNPRTVGNQQVDYVPLIVGGGDANRTYRGDSFVCAAALQAGHISDRRGGCATLQLVGNFTDFLPWSSHGLNSIGFPSVFPLSFQFAPTTDLHHCEDLRDYALAFNILVTAAIFLVLRPKPIVMFWCLVCIGFWHVTLFSEPQDTPPPLDVAFGTFLPTLFIAYGFWRVAWRFTFPAFRRAPIESSVWYLASFWPGVLTNLTMDKLPIDRLVASDIKSQPGALTALIIVCVILLVIVINQIRVIRRTGWLPQYLFWYVVGGLVVVVLSQLPGLQLRVHHYIIAIVLMPGTAFPTRLSAIYQGFLLGIFLNGAAAWGFDSILQTAADLRRDAPLGTDLPSFLTNSTSFNSSIPFVNQTIFWDVLPPDESWDGFALLIDDVERYVGTALNFSLASLQAGIPHFFRLAYTSDSQVGDFTMPATLWPNGTWVDPLPGPS